MAKRTIIVGVNQTMMAALSMVDHRGLRQRSRPRPAGARGLQPWPGRQRLRCRSVHRDHGDHARPHHDRGERARGDGCARRQREDEAAALHPRRSAAVVAARRDLLLAHPARLQRVPERLGHRHDRSPTRSTDFSDWLTTQLVRASPTGFRTTSPSGFLNPMQDLIAESPWCVTFIAILRDRRHRRRRAGARSHCRLPGRHLLPRPLAQRDGHLDLGPGRHRRRDDPGGRLRRLDGTQQDGRRVVRPILDAGQTAAVRLPGPGPDPVRLEPVHRHRGRHRVRRAGRDQAGRRRHPRSVADHGRGRRVGRHEPAGR